MSERETGRVTHKQPRSQTIKVIKSHSLHSESMDDLRPQSTAAKRSVIINHSRSSVVMIPDRMCWHPEREQNSRLNANVSQERTREKATCAYRNCPLLKKCFLTFRVRPHVTPSKGNTLLKKVCFVKSDTQTTRACSVQPNTADPH